VKRRRQKDVLYPELFNEQELVWHGTLDVGEMVTIYFAVQISNQEPNDMTMSIPSYVALTYDDAVPGMYMKMMNGAPVTTTVHADSAGRSGAGSFAGGRPADGKRADLSALHLIGEYGAAGFEVHADEHESGSDGICPPLLRGWVRLLGGGSIRDADAEPDDELHGERSGSAGIWIPDRGGSG
jgi:hypothetical protein